MLNICYKKTFCDDFQSMITRTYNHERNHYVKKSWAHFMVTIHYQLSWIEYIVSRRTPHI